MYLLLFYSATINLIPTDTEDVEENEEVAMLSGLPKNKLESVSRLMYAAPFHTQVAVLLGRTWRTIWREKVSSISIAFFYIIKMYSLAHISVMYYLRTDPDDDAFRCSCGRGFPGWIPVLADRW